MPGQVVVLDIFEVEELVSEFFLCEKVRDFVKRFSKLASSKDLKWSAVTRVEVGKRNPQYELRHHSLSESANDSAGYREAHHE
jgi:hypothetical protein